MSLFLGIIIFILSAYLFWSRREIANLESDTLKWQSEVNTQIKLNLKLNEHISHLESEIIDYREEAWGAYNKFKQVIRADESHVAQKGKNFLHPTLVSELRNEIEVFEDFDWHIKWKPSKDEDEDEATETTTEAQ